MSKAGKRPMRSLTAHEKLDAIRRVHEGESKASVARDIGVPESTLRGWCKNEDKISYLSRQSSPEADESTSGVEPKEKKQKLEEILQPYNLSKKANGVSTLSPNADYTKTDFNGTKPLNLNIKNDNYKTNNSNSMSERNKAELARLSVDLRLNQPETFMATNNISSNSVPANNLTDLTSNINLLAAHWNTLLLQHQQKSQNNYKITAPADTSSGSTGSYPVQPRLENGHISRYKTHKSSKVSDRQNMIDESLMYWFKTQSMLGLMQNQHNGLLTTAPASTVASTTNTSPNYSNITTATASTTSPNYSSHASITTNINNNVSNITTTTVTSSVNHVTSASSNTTPNVTIASSTTPNVTSTSNVYNDIHNNFKFWQWYKNDVDLYGLQQTQKFQEKPILYQQLTKTAKDNGLTETNIQNESIGNDTKEKLNDATKEGRCLLDDLLRINNNNNNVAAGDAQNNAQENILTQNEGLMHGEKFLKFLECCGDPMVTQVHILQLRYLLNNIKNGVDKKNGDLKSKCKVRRK